MYSAASRFPSPNCGIKETNTLSRPLSFQRRPPQRSMSRAGGTVDLEGVGRADLRGAGGRRVEGDGEEDGLPPVFTHVWNLGFGWSIPPRKVVHNGGIENEGDGVVSWRVGKAGAMRDTEAGSKERRGIDLLFESQFLSFETLELYLRKKENVGDCAEVKFAFLDLNEGIEKEGLDESMLAQGLNFVSLYQESCYHSTIGKLVDSPVMEIRYNAGEDLSFSVDCSIETPIAMDIHIHREATPVFFSYNFKSKSSIYAVRNDVFNIQASITEIAELCEVYDAAIHPMTCHLVIMHDIVKYRDAGMHWNMKGLLAIESQLLDGSLIGMKVLGKFGKYTQDLHDLSRELIIIEHYNDRDLANVRNLLRDLDRMEKRAKDIGKGFEIDEDAGERTRAGFACLEDLCVDRTRRLLNRKQRVQNLIALLYNLTANKDSLTSLKIAEESTKIAHETRKDSVAMKTIATLTMLYLPASFVCSFFGTNFFALNTNLPGPPTFVVSKLWWVYIVAAVPFTLGTFGIWIWWLRREARREKSAVKADHRC